MIDKIYCMSSYLALRYIEKDDVDFYEHIHHKCSEGLMETDRYPIRTAEDIDHALQKIFETLQNDKLGLLLSGGMDSAVLASYMRGCDAYTFRFLGGDFQKEELARAEYYARYYGLRLHYVEIDWHTVESCLLPVMRAKGAPVHSIEPQLYQAALQAKSDGVTRIVEGDSSDLLFGGMDQLLAKDWSFTEFKDRYIFTKPELILNETADMSYLFEKYRHGEKIDFLKFINEVYATESLGSYSNAFEEAGISYTDPYAELRMAEPLDLYRIRHGESKYLIRELMARKYPDIPVPDKTPMPRPVDCYFADWTGPKRPEFKRNLDMGKFTGNQKWQMYCLEEFLNLYE